MCWIVRTNKIAKNLVGFLFNLKRSFSFKTSFSSERQGGEFLKEKTHSVNKTPPLQQKNVLREKKVEKRTFHWSKKLFNQIFTFDATGKKSDSKELVL